MSRPTDGSDPLDPVIGRWQTSGTILDDQGHTTSTVTGTDTYARGPGGWVVHEVDVRMADEPTQAVELIGGRDAATGGWRMYAFGAEDEPEVMSMTQPEPGLLLVQGDGVRSWLRPEAGPDQMTARWEREVNGVWIAWLEMRFDRFEDPGGRG